MKEKKPFWVSAQIVKTTNKSVTVRYYESGRYRRVKFAGSWKVDNYNRLKFYLSSVKEGIKEKVFTLYGSWYVNRDNYLLYEYKSGKEKKRIVFKGNFIFLSDKKIVYKLTGSSNCLELKAELQSILRLRDRKIKYTIAVGRRKTLRYREIVLSGRWVFLPARGRIAFEMKTGNNRIKQIKFKVKKKIKKDRTIYLILWAMKKKAFEIGLEKRDLRLFARFIREGKEKKVMVGARFKF